MTRLTAILLLIASAGVVALLAIILSVNARTQWKLLTNDEELLDQRKIIVNNQQRILANQKRYDVLYDEMLQILRAIKAQTRPAQ